MSFSEHLEMYVYMSENETAIEGSVSELMNIAEYIQQARTGSKKSYELSQLATAEPYSTLLEELIFNCNGSKIKGSLEGNSLIIEFSEETADVVASYFEFEEESIHGHHYHFDQYGSENYFETSSIDMVVKVSTHNKVIE
mgnify:CR=1 FL=1